MRIKHKIIFLDIDGTINGIMTTSKGPTGYTGLDDEMVSKLHKILNITNAKIVLSSTWRIYPELIEYLYKEIGRDYFIGQTPEIFKMDSRAEEIKQYLNEHKDEIEKYIIIDDMKLRGFGDRFVRTSTDIGLTDDLTENCIEKLM